MEAEVEERLQRGCAEAQPPPYGAHLELSLRTLQLDGRLEESIQAHADLCNDIERREEELHLKIDERDGVTAKLHGRQTARRP